MTTAKAKAAPAAKENKEAVAAGKETLETVEKVTRIGAEAARAPAAGKAANGAFMGYEELVRFNRENAEVFITATTTVVKGLQDLNRTWLNLAREQVEEATAAGRALMAAKTLDEVVTIHAGLMQGSFDKLVTETTKAAELATRLAEALSAPIKERVSATVDSLFKPAA